MVLTLHIFGAVLTGVLALGSILAIRRKSKHLANLRTGILTVGMFQIISGTWLVVVTPEISVARICLASIIYLGAVFGVDLALRRAIKVQVTAK